MQNGLQKPSKIEDEIWTKKMKKNEFCSKTSQKVPIIIGDLFGGWEGLKYFTVHNYDRISPYIGRKKNVPYIQGEDKITSARS